MGLFDVAMRHSQSSGTKVWAIGVDSDQYYTVDVEMRDYILTSMLKRVDVSIFETVKSVIDGTATPGTINYDLSVDGVGYSTSGGFVDDITDELESYKSKILNGEITVPSVPSEVG